MKRSSRVVLLGASSAIGGAILARLSTNPNTQTLAVSRRPAPQDSVPQNTKWIPQIDLTKESCLTHLSEIVKNEFSDSPFSIIHSVGDFWIHRPLIQTPYSEIASMVSSHILTLFGAARFLTPLMIQNGGGQLIAFSCNSVAYSYPDMSPFTASKAAIESFVRCYANEHSEFGISACALALPTIRTEAVLQEKPNGDHANYITPGELAGIIVDQLLLQDPIISGNITRLFKYSRTFYHSSYYERNPRVNYPSNAGQPQK
jgi:NAD(P)-dependent dehydrogenase (short-subunit alcohol dehydrogenase family)